MPQQKKQTKSSRISALAVVVVFLLAFGGQFLAPHISTAETLKQLQKKSTNLQKKIDVVASEQKKLAKKASSLKSTIANLDADIAKATAKIELTSIRVKELGLKLKRTKKELNYQKNLLRSSMTALYKRGGASTVELLVGSDSFSEFIDEQEYLERLKLGIQESTEKVVELKLQIQGQQEKQQKLLDQQQAAKRALNDARSEKASILSETRGQEAAFRKRKEKLIEQQKAINREMLSRSSNVIVGGGNYPWANAVCVATGKVNGPCWNYEWRYKGSLLDPWGYYYRNCTSYVAWRVNKDGYFVPGLGNGGDWYGRAPNYARGEKPAAGATASFASNSYRHVAYVEEVYGNGQIRISEYNFVRDGVYSERIIGSKYVTGYVYPWKL